MSIQRTHGSDRGSPFDLLIPFYAITAPTFESHVLKYTYTYSSVLLILSERLRDCACFEMIKLPAAQRPEGTMTKIRGPRVDWIHADWTPPSSWVYYDEDITTLYKEGERRRAAERADTARFGLKEFSHVNKSVLALTLFRSFCAHKSYPLSIICFVCICHEIPLSPSCIP